MASPVGCRSGLRLRRFARGLLNAAGTTILVPTPSTYLPQVQSWRDADPDLELDHHGNWLETVTTVAGQATADLREANAVNEYVTRQVDSSPQITQIAQIPQTSDPDSGGAGVSPAGGGTGVPPVALAYDHNGNLTSDGTWTYAYDPENRLSSVTPAGQGPPTVQVAYDALGRRIQTTDVGGSATFHLYAAGPGVLEERAADGTLLREFIYGRDFLEPLVLVDHTSAGSEPAGTLEALYYLQDRLRNVVALTNTNGVVVERYAYDPYGATYITDAAGFRIPNSAFGNPFAWTDQRYDLGAIGPDGRPTGLYHFSFRTYSPTLGRWLQRDPLGYVDSVNLYEYVLSTPLYWIDPYGLSFWDTTWDVVAGVGTGIYNVGEGIVVGTYTAVSHPIQTAQAIGQAASSTYALARNEGSGPVRAGAETALLGLGNALGGGAILDAASGENAQGDSLSLRDRVAAGTEGAANALIAAVTVEAALPAKGAGAAAAARGAVGLDTNAIIAALEGSAADTRAVLQAIAGRNPSVSITAVKEFLRGGGDINALRSFLESMGGRVGKAPSAETLQQLEALGLKPADARVLGSAIEEGIPLLTRDKAILKKGPCSSEGF